METIASGGVEQTILTLVKGLDPQRYEHKIICTWHGGPVSDDLNNLGVELIAVGAWRHPFEWAKHRRVFQTIRSFNPHIVHGAVFEGMGMAAISGWLARVPVIILEEASDPQNRTARANWLLRKYLGRADKIMSISPSVAEYLQRVAKVTPSKITLIPNGINQPEIPDQEQVIAEKERLGIPEGNFVIGFVGRIFNDHKRLSDLIAAVALLEHKNWNLVVVGDGPDVGLIQSSIEVLGISAHVRMVGYQNNTSLYYSMMDVFCVPSSREGFGLVAAEAMLHRLPVVASQVGGLADVVLDGITGYLVPPRDPRALAKRIEKLLTEPDLRQGMGAAGYQRATESFSAARYCREVESLYLGLLKEKGVQV